MTDLPHADINQLAILDGHRLLVLAVFAPDPEDPISAIYEHQLDEVDDEPSEPLLDANTWITAVLPHQLNEASLVFGSADGEVIFADHDDVDAVEASERAISALVDVDGVTVASTTHGEVLAIAGGEVTPWKTEGPALFALGHFEGTTWIAGDDGYLARRDGESWTAMQTGTNQPLNALARTADGVIAVGGGGVVVQVEGEHVKLRTEGTQRLGGVAVWRGAVLLAAGVDGLRELTADGTKLLREGRCECVAADAKYLVISSGSELLQTEDGVVWTPLPYATPEPSDEHDHDHDHENCDHEH